MHTDLATDPSPDDVESAAGSDEETIRRRAADAATAVERFARSLAHNGTNDPVVIAYIQRLLEAASTVDERTEHDRTRTEPDPNFLGPLRRRFDPGYSAGRQP
jgi:hypothetical protein